jgi:hypothetical protein
LSEKVLTFQIFGVNSINNVTLPNVKELLCVVFPLLNQKAGSGKNVELKTEYAIAMIRAKIGRHGFTMISIDTELLVIDPLNYKLQH